METPSFSSKTQKFRPLIGIFLFSIFLVSIYLWLNKQGDDFVGVKQVEPGEALPNIEFTTSEGLTKKLYDIKGKAILLSFWASWCAPCLVELPVFQTLYEKYKDKGFVIVAINLDDEKEDADFFISRFWKKNQIKFSSFFDFTKLSAQTLQLSGLPTNYLLNEKKEVIFESTGLHDWLAPQITDQIEALLSSKN